ncbi:efflux RND transporter periplasmic adaptor subunit [Spirosoma endbachense]|uniref:Efflux RND transporter periplasmic adaptor subunit n=1 Tax=Spirosoma endbachense TaxID=2666025 RepID=A0A6P1VP99_9BACT|nr:efflux RND transporter periplasmic adaptor subunit [Spirosoma endbachense]QHV94535.1 efflux RND transporter periplasmic adaptor subunit [Spirosoma endbachense]
MKNYGILAALLMGAVLIGCTGKEAQTDQPETLTLPVVKLARQSTTLKKEYVGTLEAVRNVEIRARVSGFLEKIFVDEGQPVRQGQLLFKLNEAEYQAELDKAKANLKSAVAGAKTAEVELGRVKLLVDKNVVSPSELELAKAKLDAARASIDEAKSMQDNAALRLSHASVKAPFDGVINRIPFKMGSLIEEGALLTSVSDTREVYAYFDVSEKEYLAYVKKHRKNPSEGIQTVEMLLADDSKYAHKGKIETVESVFEEGAGTIAFRARFPNPEKLLRHGSSGKIRLANDVDDALLVPQKAVFEVQDKNYVYIVDASNKVKSRSFVTQGRVDQYYLVQSGLEPGERVVYEGIQNVRDGMQIIPEAVSADSLSSQSTLAQQ